MKLKLPQIFAAIALAAHFFSHVMYFVNWIKLGGNITFSFGFLIWPITFLFELVALLGFVLLYKNNLLRYLSVGLFFASRFFYGIYITTAFDFPIRFLFDHVIGWPYWQIINANFFGNIFSLVSVLLLLVATVMSLVSSLTHSTLPELSQQREAPTEAKFVSPGIPTNASTQIENIDALGDLLKKGLLTQEEFDRKKREILGFE